MGYSKKNRSSNTIFMIVVILFILTFLFRYFKINEGFKEGLDASGNFKLKSITNKYLKADVNYASLLDGAVNQSAKNNSKIYLYQVESYNLFLVKEQSNTRFIGIHTDNTLKPSNNTPTLDTIHDYLLASVREQDFSGNAILYKNNMPIMLYKIKNEITNMDQGIDITKLIVTNYVPVFDSNQNNNLHITLNNYSDTQNKTNFKLSDS